MKLYPIRCELVPANIPTTTRFKTLEDAENFLLTGDDSLAIWPFKADGRTAIPNPEYDLAQFQIVGGVME